VLGMNTNTAVKFSTYLAIVVLNYMMLYIGYLGEIGEMSRFVAMVLGFIAFFIMFFIIFATFVMPKYVLDNYILYAMYLVVWGLYGIVYMFGEEYKNIIMNILDCIAKCFIGIGLWAYYTKIIRF
jgi:undecaprenyl pyrophosphate phosphatase UppP